MHAEFRACKLWSIEMSKVRFAGACMAAALLALWSQEPMAQGLLSGPPQPFDGVLSHDPLGPSQKFGDLSPGSEARSTTLERAPAARPQQAYAAPRAEPQTKHRSHLAFRPRQTAVRSFARQDDLQRGAAGSGSVLALAPVKQARVRPLCFPSSTIHLQANERDACNGGAPVVKGRFEELLNE
jgi:hypothetical protein